MKSKLERKVLNIRHARKYRNFSFIHSFHLYYYCFAVSVRMQSSTQINEHCLARFNDTNEDNV